MTTTTSRFPDGLPDLLAGVYKHHKGGLYQVLGYGEDSTNGLEEPRPVVVYIGLQLPGLQLPDAASSMRLKVRDAEEFHDWVHLDDGSVCGSPSLSGACEAHGRLGLDRFTYLDVEVPDAADH